ncbi:cuticle protein 8-like [Culex pipiens pallens]|uniref:cuticle protein 8-like n=1 Tax=Culex pipiens pallens TaxID=42434 RepID=UPI001952A24C|nr:cuticle protein 8-like [Culex pipiens pallens]
MQKFIAVVACLVAVAAALPYKNAPAAPIVEPAHYAEPKDSHHHPQYKFEYGVQDGHTGDHKAQWEQRDGDHVKGSYTLDEADGGHRVVEYQSDGHGGINIQVKKVGGHAPALKAPQHHHHEIVAPIPVVPVPVKSIKTKHQHTGESYANLKKHHY